jgi:hypothetical protein
MRLLPRIATGGWSSETLDGQGLEGRFFEVEWLGCALEISFASVAAHERQMAKWRREREERA